MIPQRSLFCFWGRRDGEVGVALSEPMAPQPGKLSFRDQRGHAMASRALAAQRPYIAL
jgi:hypothetical protein